jgi:hypothetical protein
MSLRTILLISLSLALTGCRTPPAPAPTPLSKKAHARVTGIERLDIPIAGVLLVKPDHYLTSYDRLMVDPIIVTFARGSMKLSLAETERLETHLREATARELVNVDPSKIVSEPGPCVLQMQTAFLEIELPTLEALSSSHSTFVSSFGSVSLVHELRDSMTGSVLLRYMGRRRARGGTVIGFSKPWSGLTRIFDEMLSDLQHNLVEAVPLSIATQGPLAACKGLIYKSIEDG